MNSNFEKNGYLIARNFFDDATIHLAARYFDLKYKFISYVEEVDNKPVSRDFAIRTSELDDVANSIGFYGDPLLESMQLVYGQKVSTLIDIDLSPTYSYARIYEQGNALIPHTDRVSCEISLTCPVLISDDRPSKIFVSNIPYFEGDKEFDFSEIKKRGDYSEIILYPGDALFYKGCERYHWRDPLESNLLIQFFMHFVETNGANNSYIFDKRPFLGFPGKYRSF